MLVGWYCVKLNAFHYFIITFHVRCFASTLFFWQSHYVLILILAPLSPWAMTPPITFYATTNAMRWLVSEFFVNLMHTLFGFYIYVYIYFVRSIYICLYYSSFKVENKHTKMVRKGYFPPNEIQFTHFFLLP